MQIFLRIPGGKMITVDVETMKTIADLKKHIESSQAIPAAEQRLILKGNVLDDATKIEDSGITAECIVFLSIEAPEESEVKDSGKIQVAVSGGKGESILIMLNKKDTIAEVMKKICEKTGDKEAEILLVYKGQRLDMKMTVEGANIKSKDSISIATITHGGSF
eukprot:TRINITY_DN1429_c0_g1_i1.p1 TRINITY_DN1429_c0_g1~~TRINITY_DN1429_c0_g1_i1.p1  ORF type:complete len:163 (-),score=55.25 TRINITY_DN1429_c0_g1_i1:196-684(-)